MTDAEWGWAGVDALGVRVSYVDVCDLPPETLLALFGGVALRNAFAYAGAATRQRALRAWARGHS